MKRTLIVGATTNPDRYAYKAAHKLTDHGHEIVPFGIKKGEVAGEAILNSWDTIEEIDTVTLYVGPKNQPDYYQKIIDVKPKRVIFNPGTENPEFQEQLSANGIAFEEACTLVLLSVGNY